MARVQLALNVADLEACVKFYAELFQAEPHKQRPGYANFEIDEPPLKLVLLQVDKAQRGSGVRGALNHLGIEVESSSQVRESQDRLLGQGLPVVEESDTTCCFARQDKVWVRDPAGTPWEIYAITDDNPDSVGARLEAETGGNDGGCCTSQLSTAPEDLASSLQPSCC